MGIIFIIHLLIFVIYLGVKVLSILKKSLFKDKKYLLYFEYTVLIVAFLIVHMQIFVFSPLNLKETKWSHSYFIFCFIIALLYIIVFAVFWLYSAFRLLGSGLYFMDPYRLKQFKYFFTGYHRQKWKYTYDLWRILIHFIIGVLIGTAWKHYLF